MIFSIFILLTTIAEFVSCNTGCVSEVKHLLISYNLKSDSNFRIGLIGRKIGVVPMWYKNGKPFSATMIHVRMLIRN